MSDYVQFQTKVSKRSEKILRALAKKRGTTVYGLIQLTCQFLVRMASGWHEITPEIKKLMTMFHMEPGWQNCFNSTDPKAKLDVAQEILILQQYTQKASKKEKRNGYGAVMINKPYFGTDWQETECVDTIVERVIEVCMPGVYKRLRVLSELQQCQSISDLLITLTDAKIIEDMNQQDLAEIYQDTNTEITEYGKRTRRKKRVSPDDLQGQTVIKFTDEDRQSAEEEVDDGTR